MATIYIRLNNIHHLCYLSIFDYKMKVIVYTINLDGYDPLHESPKIKWENIDDFQYLYFTDGQHPEGWERVEHPKGGRKESRFYKINSHLLPPHDISVYLDASYGFKKPINKMLEYLREADIALSLHGKDNCLYDHAITCITCKLDDPIKIFEQVGRYASEDYPRMAGLTENSFIIRRNNGKIKELNELWWEEYQKGSQRDQLSLPYALWKTKPKLSVLPFSARENKWLHSWGIHNKSNKWKLNK